jgi:hypothetical protein
MDTDYERELTRLPPSCQRMMEFAMSDEPFCSSYHQDAGVARGGMTDQLDLQSRRGLIKPVGKRDIGRGGPDPMFYVASRLPR